jgi:hypothetical protein
MRPPENGFPLRSAAGAARRLTDARRDIALK